MRGEVSVNGLGLDVAYLGQSDRGESDGGPVSRMFACCDDEREL